MNGADSKACAALILCRAHGGVKPFSAYSQVGLFTALADATCAQNYGK